MPSEPLLILCYDSDADAALHPSYTPRAAYGPHTAAVIPADGPQSGLTRESIEVRTYVFWDPPDGPIL